MRFLAKFLRTMLFENLNEGTSHWMTQRVSSIVLIPLTAIFVFTFAQNFGLGYEENLQVYKKPFNAFCAFLFLSITLLHFKQGAQVVIEDYVHSNGTFKLLIKTNIIFFWAMNLLIAGALGKIVLENNWS